MIRLALPLLIATLGASVFAAPAHTRARFSAGLSDTMIEVKSDFSGARLLVFGALEDGPRARGGIVRDVIVALKGPRRTIALRKKDRIAGLWINSQSRIFRDVPAWYALAASRPLTEILDSDQRARLKLGAEHALQTPDALPPQQREAFLRLMRTHHNFSDAVLPAAFLGQRLFRAEFPLPSASPIGDYEIAIYLVEAGRVREVQTRSLRLDKTGFGQAIFAFAHEQSLAYGLLAVLLALSIGWAVSTLFNRR